MTGKEFLQAKYPKQLGGILWNTNENIDDNWVAQMLEEYHESEVKNLGLFSVSQRSELLINFASYLNETYNLNIEIDDQDVESFLKMAL